MDYTEVDCTVHPVHEFTEIVIAYLASIGYSMFEETDHGVKAYIETKNFDAGELEKIPAMIDNERAHLNFVVRNPEQKNWNEEWEKNFSPVVIGKSIYVRAEYHPADPTFLHELVIHPRMAFGTGHHATTALMMESMLEIDFKNKNVLDMGCGTGILAILASRLGARHITAIDIDRNAVENSQVNCKANNVENVIFMEGDASLLANRHFDIILANINRNIILEDMPLYTKSLSAGGMLLTSGYQPADYMLIESCAAESGLKSFNQKNSGNWCQATFHLSK